MRDEDPFEHLPLDPERLNAEIVLVDLVYAGSESRLIAEAREPERDGDRRTGGPGPPGCGVAANLDGYGSTVGRHARGSEERRGVLMSDELQAHACRAAR